MQRAVTAALLCLMPGVEVGQSTGVWRKLGAGRLRAHSAGAVLLFSVVCARAGAMGDKHLKYLGLRTAGHGEVLQAVLVLMTLLAHTC